MIIERTRDVVLLAASALALQAPAFPVFAQSTTAPTGAIRSTTPAKWARAPTSADMVWPEVAFYAHISGHVVLDCLIASDEKLKPCTVVNDTPEGAGFARAAIRFLEPTKIRPPTVDGAPLQDVHVEISIDFNGRQQHDVRFSWRWYQSDKTAPPP